MSSSEQMWKDHFLRMGNFTKPRKFYTVSSSKQTGAGDIQLVSPTEQQLNQAKMKLKRKRSDSKAETKRKRRKQTNKKTSPQRKAQSKARRKGRQTKKSSCKKKTTKRKRS